MQRFSDPVRAVGSDPAMPADRPWTSRPTLAASLLLAAVGCGPAGPDATRPARGGWAGVWTVELAAPGGPLPFEIELGTEPPSAVIRNGAERLVCPPPQVRPERVTLRFDRDSTLELTTGPGDLRLARWALDRGAGPGVTRMSGPARRAAAPRFDPAPIPAEVAARLAPRYRVDFESSDDDAVGLFDVGTDGVATGTFLTSTGDYRFLAGAFDGHVLRLSCFDGAHAFLFQAVRDPDGTLAGKFWSGTGWEEIWIAEPDADAALPDGFTATEWRAGAAATLTFPDLEGVPRRLDDPELTGRAQVVVVFGSWCPNCHDALRLWADLERRYRNRGLRVVGLAFERTADFAREAPKLREFVAHRAIDFPVLVAGLADKAAASASLPVLDRVRAFPTTIVRDAAGAAVAVHTGFTGPAAPVEHAALVARFEAILAGLLAD